MLIHHLSHAKSIWNLVISDIRSILDENLYAEVVRHTPYPKHVEALSKEFVNDVLKGKNYVSVHWRFNSGDWMNRCEICLTGWTGVKFVWLDEQVWNLFGLKIIRTWITFESGIFSCFLILTIKTLSRISKEGLRINYLLL